MFGSGGNDTLRGGNGNDEVDGEDGNDNVSGGDGDDKLFGDHFKSPGADVIDGGPGFDRVIDDYPAGEGAVSVTLDNVANDGRAGENDNLIGIEEIEGPQGTYVGSDAAETFTVGATGAVVERERRGRQRHDHDAQRARERRRRSRRRPHRGRVRQRHDHGRPGARRDLRGLHRLTSAGSSRARCRSERHGQARDGEVDSIDCGVGADRAVIDAFDTHANCETVEVARGPRRSGADGRREADLLTRRSIRQIAWRGLKIRVACPAACTIVADLTTNRALARKLRLPRSRKLAGARKTLRGRGDDPHAEGREQGEAPLPAPAQGNRDPAGADDRQRQEDDDGHADAEAQAVS